MEVKPPAAISLGQFQQLIEALVSRGFRVLGPVVRDGAIVYGDVGGIRDLPAGWTDRQERGEYRLERRPDNPLFGYAVGPQSWKRFLHPPIEQLWRMRRNADGTPTVQTEEKHEKFAFLGVRACELHGIAIQDRVFIDGLYPDVRYRRRRQDAFIIAVNCGEPSGTCFCVSMGTGPKADSGFDLALTELLDGDSHLFIVETGSIAGSELLEQISHREASAEEVQAANAVVVQAAGRMGRRLDTDGLKEALQGAPDHPRWDEVAGRCLGCANCTMVCPTCFCTTVTDHSDLSGREAERVRRWDSCFNLDFSFIHGGAVRPNRRARYRQWMTHKLANWIDQFGTSGCVGCGRCITWCPVGIDITEEAAAIRAPISGEGRHGGA